VLGMLRSVPLVEEGLNVLLRSTCNEKAHAFRLDSFENEVQEFNLVGGAGTLIEAVNGNCYWMFQRIEVLRRQE